MHKHTTELLAGWSGTAQNWINQESVIPMALRALDCCQWRLALDTWTFMFCMYQVIIFGVFEYFLSLYHFVSIFLSFPFFISNKSLLCLAKWFCNLRLLCDSYISISHSLPFFYWCLWQNCSDAGQSSICRVWQDAHAFFHCLYEGCVVKKIHSIWSTTFSTLWPLDDVSSTVWFSYAMPYKHCMVGRP